MSDLGVSQCVVSSTQRRKQGAPGNQEWMNYEDSPTDQNAQPDHETTANGFGKPARSRAKGSWADEESRDLSFLACFGKAQCIAATPVQELEGWRRVGITVDSGAADSVADLVASPAAR